MRSEDICNKLPAFLEGALKPCCLVVKSTTFPAADGQQTLKQAIHDFKPVQGWLCIQSNVLFFHESKKFVLPEGVLLNGEAVNENGESLHIREDGKGGWLLTSFREVDPEEEEECCRCMVEDFAFLGTSHAKDPKDYPQITYRRYWNYDEDFGCRQFSARFTGFQQEGSLS